MNLVERLQEWWLGVRWAALKRVIDLHIGNQDFAYGRLRIDGRDDLICIYRARSYNHAWDIDRDEFNYHHVERQVYGTFVLTRLAPEEITLYTKAEFEPTRQAPCDTSGIRARPVIEQALERIQKAGGDAWLPVLTDKDGIVWALNSRSNIQRRGRQTTFVVDMLNPDYRHHPHRVHAPACFYLERLHTYPGTWHETLGDLEYPDRKPITELVLKVVVTRSEAAGGDLVVHTPIEGTHLHDVHRYSVQVLANQKIDQTKCIDAAWVERCVMAHVHNDLNRQFMVATPYTYRNQYKIDENL